MKADDWELSCTGETKSSHVIGAADLAVRSLKDVCSSRSDRGAQSWEIKSWRSIKLLWYGMEKVPGTRKTGSVAGLMRTSLRLAVKRR